MLGLGFSPHHRGLMCVRANLSETFRKLHPRTSEHVLKPFLALYRHDRGVVLFGVGD